VSVQAVYPTPVVGMVGLLEDIKYVTTQTFKQAGDLIYLIGEAKPEFGGSELQKLTDGQISGKPPELDLETEARRQHQLLAAIQSGLVQSAHDVSEGGFAPALAECLFGTENLGANVVLKGNPVTALFSETQSRFIVSVKKEHQQAFQKLVDEAVWIGNVTDDKQMAVKGENGETWIQADTEECETAWKGALKCLLK